ncbi:hypothetical protein D3C78_270900 [compost metagenome]
MNSIPESDTPVLLLSPNSVAKALDLSRCSVYDLMRNGTLSWVQFGSDRRIPFSEVQRLAAEGVAVISPPKNRAAKKADKTSLL